MKQPIKKKDFKKKSIADFKAAIGIEPSTENLVNSCAEKPQDFITLPKAFQEATKLPGIPMGVSTIVYGHSNTGKSLIKNHVIASAQKKNILPVIIETEQNFSMQFAVDCGMDATPVYGNVEVEDIDPETGEVSYHTENRIISWDGDFLYFDSTMLAEKYGDFDYAQGKKVSKKRKYAVIEDVAHLIGDLLDLQDNGDIDRSMVFIWDSVGSLPCFKSMASNANNAMWGAGALKAAFEPLIMGRIPQSKKVSSPYTNTVLFINKVWVDSMSAPGAAPSLRMSGGEGLTYGARLTIQLGGVISAGTTKLIATSGGEKYVYGLKTKIAINKNQLDSPYNVTYMGTAICSGNGLVSENDLDEFKKTSISKILKELKERMKDHGKDDNISESDIEFEEEDGED